MDSLITVVVVHETAAPGVRRPFALCAEHLQLLQRASWARVDEVVGFSSVMDCEACSLIPGAAPEQPVPSGPDESELIRATTPDLFRTVQPDRVRHPHE